MDMFVMKNFVTTCLLAVVAFSVIGCAQRANVAQSAVMPYVFRPVEFPDGAHWEHSDKPMKEGFVLSLQCMKENDGKGIPMMVNGPIPEGAAKSPYSLLNPEAGEVANAEYWQSYVACMTDQGWYLVPNSKK